MKNAMKIFAGIAGIAGLAAGVGAAVVSSKKNNETTPIETNLNDEIGLDTYGKWDKELLEFLEEQLTEITYRKPVSVCGDEGYNSYLHSLSEMGSSISSYYYMKKNEVDNLILSIKNEKLITFYFKLGSRIFATQGGRYGDIITMRLDFSLGDEFDYHFVNIHGKWKFITYEQLEADTQAAIHYEDGGTSSSHRLLHGVQIVALRDDTEEV